MTMTLREEALKLHMDNNGKIAVVSKVPIATRHDLAIAYTPGVAEPCKDILRIYLPWQHGCYYYRRYSCTRLGRHRSRGCYAGNGRQGCTVQNLR